MTIAVRNAATWTTSVESAQVAALAKHALLAELDTWPKPGLVSRIDSGSHDDMDAATFEASAAALEPYFDVLVTAGLNGASFSSLRAIGIDAERSMMLATGGINTHRGAIFGLGLLCAAVGTCRTNGVAADARALCATVRDVWGAAILSGPVDAASHGAEAQRRYGVGGARLQAASGFPHVLDAALPALRRGRRAASGDENAARVEAFFAVLAGLDDTNILHRGGPDGLAYGRAEASAFLSGGGVARADWKARAAATHAGFVARRLSPGGCADILALAIFLDAMDPAPAPDRA